MKNIPKIIQPLAILTFSLLMTTIVVGMIAYANCEDARIWMDILLGNPPLTVSTLPQA